uniref:Kinesin motor domain-containing protein n=1 Tax=Periophthalmus magnuspinnatus TaxID=409849 RepID=A0A3B3ZJJ9_9GOBI
CSIRKVETPRRPQKKPSNSQNDPVGVYCRITSTVQLHAPEGFKTLHLLEKVFRVSVSQKELFECVAKPLVEDLISGKNGMY